MKKRLVVVLAALMMLSTTTVLANPSIETVTGVSGADASGNSIALTVNNTDTVLEDNKATAISKAENDLNGDVIAMVNIEGTLSGVDNKITVFVASVQSGETYKVLHYTGTEWLTHDAVVYVSGQLTILDVDSLSPFYIVKVNPAPAAPAPAPEAEKAPIVWIYGSAAPAATETPAATLPKTGAVAVLPFAAMACLAGAVVCGRKEK